MKKYILFILFTTLSVWSFSQENDISQIKAISSEMLNKTEKGEYAKLLDYMYPPFFELFTKEQVTEIFKMMFEGNEEFTIKIDVSNPNYTYSEIFQKEDTKYAFVGHQIKMDMNFNREDFSQEEVDLMKLAMKAQGLEVLNIVGTNVSVLSQNSVMIMINDEETDGEWKSLNYDSDNAFLYQVVPTFVLEDAKEFKENLMLQNAKQKELKK